MKQERVDLWSAASFATAPAAVVADHLESGTTRHLAPRLVERLTGGTGGECEAAELLSTVSGRHRAQDLDGLSGRELKRRAKVVAEGNWAGAAVSKAIAEVQAAVNAAVIGAVAASTAGAGAAGS